MTYQQQVLVALLQKFPKASSKTLARMAYKQNPTLWPGLEAARNTARRIRGASGKDRTTVVGFTRPKQKSGDPFGKLPEPAKSLFEWKAVDVPGPVGALILADMHIPYHDPAALRAALHWGRGRGAEVVVLNGDVADFFSVSHWEKDPRERNFAAEIQAVREFLAVVRAVFPRARVLYKLGNHEERYIRYMWLKAPELLGVGDFDIASVLRFKDYGIELVDNCCVIKVGPLNVLHGHEYKFAISNPVNPARGLFLRGKVHAVCGHFHQSSQHSEKNLEQKVVSTWSTGCLCNLNPYYQPINNWNHGFLYADVNRGGSFQVKNLRIVDGKVYE